MLPIISEIEKFKSGLLNTETHLQYRNGIIMSFAGIILFCLIRSLEIHLSEKDLRKQNILKYSNLILKMMRWAVVIIAGDIAIQSFDGSLTRLPDYSMRYQSIGGLLAIELLILIRRFGANKNGHPTEQIQ